MKKTKIIIGSLVTVLCTTFSFSQSVPEMAPDYKAKPYVGLQIGTLGAGLQFAWPINNMISLRANGTYLPTMKKQVVSAVSTINVTSDYSLSSSGASLMADFSFFKNKPGIRLSTGVVYNASKFNGLRSYHEATYDIDFTYRRAYRGDWGHWDDLPETSSSNLSCAENDGNSIGQNESPSENTYL